LTLKLSIINLDFEILFIFIELKSKFPSSKPLINLYFLTKGFALSEWNVVTTAPSFWVLIEINNLSLLVKSEFKFKSKILLSLISKLPFKLLTIFTSSSLTSSILSLIFVFKSLNILKKFLSVSELEIFSITCIESKLFPINS